MRETLQLVVDLDLGYRLNFIRQAGVDDNVTRGLVGEDYIDFCHSFLWLFFFLGVLIFVICLLSTFLC